MKLLICLRKDTTGKNDNGNGTQVFAYIILYILLSYGNTNTQMQQKMFIVYINVYFIHSQPPHYRKLNNIGEGLCSVHLAQL